MQLLVTERFRRAYRSLSAQDRKRVQKALCLTEGDQRHPSLRVSHIQGTEKVWEPRASKSLRTTSEVHDVTLVLRNVGHHQDALRSPWVRQGPGRSRLTPLDRGRLGRGWSNELPSGLRVSRSTKEQG